MNKLFCYVRVVRCDACEISELEIEKFSNTPGDYGGKAVASEAKKKGWLVFQNNNHNGEVHICPKCRRRNPRKK